MRSIALGFVLVLAGCSSSSPSDDNTPGSDAGDASVLDSAPDSTNDVANDAPDPACETLKGTLQTALDGAREKVMSPDAILAVSTADCGQMVLTSGGSGISDQDLFRIGSVTKPYTASLVLRLVAAGTLSLDDVIETWVVGVPNGATATLRHLLTHTSGIFNYTNDPQVYTQLTKTWTPAELVAIAAAQPPSFAPGTSWEYSNTNFVLLGMIAEQVGGAPIAEQIRSELLQPSSLEHTFLAGSETVNGALAPCFLQNGADATSAIDPSAAWAAGAMVATAEDTNRWIALLASGQIHDATVQAEMLTPTPTTAPNVSWGLGVQLLDESVTGGAGPGIGHGGDIPGFHTQSFYFPETELGITSIVNKDGADPNEITAAVLTSLFP